MVVPGKQKSRFYLWAVRMLVLTLVFGQLGVYGGGVAQAAAVGGGTIVSASKDYRYVMTKDGGKLQVNQKDIDLSWVRSYNVSATGYSFTRRQSVLGNVDYITKIQFGSYSSKYAGQIDHAFFVDFSRIYETYSEMTYRQSGMNVGQWTIIHDDVLGLPTPTYVYDYQANPLTLVVNADTGEVVDFNSELNPYYKNKAEYANPDFESESPTPFEQIPAAPSNLSATKNDSTIMLSWDHVQQAFQYEIEEDGVIKGPFYGTTFTNNVLAPNTSHTYRVRALNPLGASDWSSVYEVKTLLAKPILSSSSEEGKNTIKWTAVDNADRYQLVIDGGQAIDLGNVTSYEHEGLEANSSHTYSLKALSSNNESQWSSTITQLVVPNSANGLKTTAVAWNKISISWDAIKGATGYDLEIDGVITPVTGTTYTKTGLGANTEHTFRIRSKNAGGAGKWTEMLNVTTQLSTPVIQASPSQEEVMLAWPAVDGATKYEVEADGVVVGTMTEPTFTHSSLLPGTAHKYRVRTLNDTNTSAWTAILTQNTVPGAVSGLAINTTTNVAIALKWTAVTGATGYDLEIDGTVVPVTGVAYTKSGLVANTEHTFRIRSKNAAGPGTWSEPINATTLLNTPVLKATSDETKVTLTWADIADATKYEVEADGVVVGTVTEPTYTHSSLLPGTAHKYRVRALTETNTSAWTAVLTQNTVPGAVSGLAINTTTNVAIALKWTVVTGATGYDLEIDGTVVPVTGAAYTKSGLAANTEHTFRIRSKNAAGLSTWSEPISATTLLNTPVLKATSDETKITLTWAEIDGATKYEVEADGVVVGTVDEPTYTHGSLLPGTAHKYRVRALTDTNTSAWTAVLTQNTVPGAVNGLAINTTTNVAIALKWTAVTGATGYDLEIDGTVVPVTGVAYTKSGLAANTEHTFRIRSKNAAGVGAWSEPISATTLLNTPVLKATSDETKVTLTWAEIDGATKYEVEADGVVVGTVDEPTFTHSNLLPGTAHKYRIRALTDTNTSALTAVLTQNTVPGAVSGLAINTTTNVAIALKWTAVTGATGYDLEIDGTIVPVTGVSYTKSGLGANTQHTFRIRSKNAAGVGAWSESINATTLLNTPVLKATSDETKVTLTWAEIDGATKYEVEADGVVVGTVDEPTFTHSNLFPGTAHKYRVRALTETNTSAWTAVLTQNTVPGAVSGLAINTTTNVAIALKWTAVTGATGYDLEIDGTVVPVTGVAYTKSGLAANTEHTFRIRSKNAAGAGAWSESINATTLLNTPVLKATSEETKVTLTWAEIDGATKYEVEADGVVVGTVTEPTYVHGSLLPGTAHKYRVRALTDTNTSAWTAILTQNTVPGAVSGLAINSTTNVAIALKWTAVTGATGYDLEIDGTVVPVTGVAYTKSGLAANTEHTFRIRSKNAAGVGAWSELISATTLLNTPVLKATSDETTVALTWAEIDGATKYEVEADGVVVGTVDEPAYTHSSLLPGTAHKYRVRALTDTNTSAWTAVLTQNTVPGAVSGLAINSTTNVAIALKWTAVTGATGYDLEIDGTVVPVTGVAYTKSGLAANTEHTFRIRSKNAAGPGAWSEPINATTLLNTPVLKATSDETTVALTWAEIDGATKYEVEADGVVVGTVTDPTYVHGNLLPGTAHKYRVRALTDTNTSAWTAVLTQNTVPGAVSGLAINTTTNVAIALKWTAVTGATGYDLEIDGTVVPVTGVAYTKSGLAANTEHAFRIRSKNAAGVGAWSEPIGATTLLNTPVLKGTADSTSIALGWDAVAGATFYEIEADGQVVGTTSDPQWIHADLLPASQHKYRIRAVSEQNSSAWSAVLTIKVLN